MPARSRLTSPDETACSFAKTISGRFVFAATVTQEGSLQEGISHFIITLLSRFQLLSELDGPSLYRRCGFNMFCLQLVITQVTDGELYETDFLVNTYLEHTLLSS